MANRCSDPFNVREAPSGAGTAHRFPWYQSGWWLTLASEAKPLGTRFRFRPVSLGANPYGMGPAPLFTNPQPWPVYIDEVRFIVMPVTLPTASTALIEDDLGRRVSVRMSTTNKGDIFSDFMPISSLITDERPTLEHETAGAVWTLPADYFLPGDAEFSIELTMAAAGIYSASDRIQVGFRGCDPYNKTPIARFSAFENINAGAGATSAEFSISGSSGDRAIRNMWLRDITFGMNATFNTVAVQGFWDFWSAILLRVEAPQGPKWTTDRYTSALSLIDQFGVHRSLVGGSDPANQGFRRTVACHRPVTPYVLGPQDKMDIEGMLMTALDTTRTYAVLTTVKGYQEVPDYAR